MGYKLLIQGITLGTSAKAGSSDGNNSKSWCAKHCYRFSDADLADNLARSKPFNWEVEAGGKGLLYIKHDDGDEDWDFKVLYKIRDDGELPEFQGEDYQTGKYGNPIELEDNEFDNLNEAYRYAEGIVRSEEMHSEYTLEQLLER